MLANDSRVVLFPELVAARQVLSEVARGRLMRQVAQCLLQDAGRDPGQAQPVK